MSFLLIVKFSSFANFSSVEIISEEISIARYSCRFKPIDKLNIEIKMLDLMLDCMNQSQNFPHLRNYCRENVVLFGCDG